MKLRNCSLKLENEAYEKVVENLTQKVQDLECQNKKFMNLPKDYEKKIKQIQESEKLKFEKELEKFSQAVQSLKAQNDSLTQRNQNLEEERVKSHFVKREPMDMQKHLCAECHDQKRNVGLKCGHVIFCKSCWFKYK